jgi:ribokinase
VTGERSPGEVLVVGSANMDLLMRVAALPGAGETVLGADAVWRPGGKGANQAVAAALAGGRVRMVGRVGADEQGEAMRDALAAAGVDTALVRTDPRAETGMAVVLVARDGENAIVVSPGANHALTPADVREAAGQLGSSDVLLVQMEVRHDVVVDAVSAAAGGGGRGGARAVLNLAPAAELADEALQRVDLLVVNRSEAEFLLGRALPDAADRAQGAAELRDLGPRAVVLTAGSDGAVVADAAGVRVVPALEVEVVDTAGAGDAFVGVLCAALATGATLDDAVAAGTRAGAVAVRSLGAQLSRRTADVEYLSLPPVGSG